MHLRRQALEAVPLILHVTVREHVHDARGPCLPLHDKVTVGDPQLQSHGALPDSEPDLIDVTDP